jgi:putative ABC transport system substrate-binding protein
MIGAPIQRRSFLTLLGGAVVAWPLAARAQQSAMPVIGSLNAGSADGAAVLQRAFHQGLSEMGYVEGRNVAVEYRWADGRLERLPGLAADLIRRRVTVIATGGSVAAAQAAHAATSTIPIVFSIAADPVGAGLVTGLNRPGGNATGLTTLAAELVPKRLQLLHEVVPRVTSISVLTNPMGSATAGQTRELQAAARTLGLQLTPLHVSSEREIETALAALGQSQDRALFVPPDLFFLDRSAQIGALTLRYAIPAIDIYRQFVAAGGLMSYGGSQAEAGRLVGEYTGRILKGARIADLPVHQATRVELIINMKTAKALGLTFPLTLLGRADEVIE